MTDVIVPRKFYTGIYSDDPHYGGVREWDLESFVWDRAVGIEKIRGTNTDKTFLISLPGPLGPNDISCYFSKEDAQKAWERDLFRHGSWEEKVEYAKQHGLPEGLDGTKI